MLNFLYQPRLVCSSPLHLRSAWTVISANFVFTAFCEVHGQKVLGTSAATFRELLHSRDTLHSEE
jgi:hypothetical protein